MSKQPNKRKLDQHFFEDVFEVVKLIPRGRVSTYGAIARYLGAAKSARMVGYALNQCMDRPDIPAHRVVNRNGMLSGKHHFSSDYPMEARLMDEGIAVEDNHVKEFDRLRWDPKQELL